MQKKVENKSSVLRKILIIVFLPLLIFIWMTGWTLTQMGNLDRPIEVQQRIKIKNGLKEHSIEAELSNQDNEESRMPNEPIIAG